MRGAGFWAGIEIPMVAVEEWSRAEVLDGLREIERLRRQADAMSIRLCAALGPGERDTAAAVSRATGIGPRAARDLVRGAAVAEQLPGALDALAAGEMSIEHLRVLGPVSADPGAPELLRFAVEQNPEDLRRAVTRFQLAHDPGGLAVRQRQARSVRFFRADRGCVGVRAVLTPLEGEELRNRLAQAADAAWRAAHPDRADTLGGHDDEPYERRLADAMVAVMRGDAVAAPGKPAVVVTIDAVTLEAELIGHGPIATADAVDVAARAEVYACIRSALGAPLRLGRARRLASAVQRLALIVRDKGCTFPGCDAHWHRCDAHHVVEYEHGGPTDIDNLTLTCPQHHRHLHHEPTHDCDTHEAHDRHPGPPTPARPNGRPGSFRPP